MIRTLGLVSALALATALGGCAAMNMPGFDGAPPVVATAPVDYVRDIHSYARPEIARVNHVSLDLAADFQAQTLSGTAALDITGEPGANEIVLDARNLDIQDVRDAGGNPLQFETGASDPILGQPLTVRFPALAPGERRRIVIRYATRPDAAALQWLTPAQTASGDQPYMFSQGQAILTRTWVPTQDSPGIRQTWDARIVAPSDLKPVMSAEAVGGGQPAGPGQTAWRFREPNPVPPYLIAIGIGDVAFQAIDERTGVWTEPSMLHAAHDELIPTAEMVDVAERLYGPYRWGRYDILVLPPSFPFGGMENPRLTFATPTIIAGDRSLVSLVAHELAHSWSGNLVTNATWADFWLNEGFTVYFENRIMEAVYGRERALMLQSLGWGDLQSTLADLPPADTRLKLDLAGRDPDEGLTDVAYEKGAAFLHTIERIVGRERFDTWLKGYFERNAFRPMTTERFLEDIRTHLVTTPDLERQLMMDAWIYQPGMPSNWVPPVSDAFVPVDAAARAFFADKGPASAIPWSGWSTQERQRFLAWRPADLRDGADWLTEAQLADLEATLNLREEGNAEVLFAWLQIAVQHRYQPAVPTLEKFLTTMGRRKFVLPLFASLWAEGDWGRPIATRLYAQARPGYHPVTTNSVDAVVGRP
ncbi:M1 family metallopeptidase [Roseibacterium beibuensis]|uniref:M1 family metallopeptidase n=1 Tax=[Roseibacterium] beibuensis TaxID=1193142 RepID=UPI00217DFC88|nr:M1 family metallopeptidase [Roseibacterium beibuensis]MCS6627433.1 M1 family metallopeptidase [Roseibacterium beibuensis]